LVSSEVETGLLDPAFLVQRDVTRIRAANIPGRGAVQRHGNPVNVGPSNREVTHGPFEKKITLPSMTPGTGRSIAVHRFGVAGGRPKVYLQAAIHANELPGAMALHHLMPMLVAADRAKRIRGEIVVVPTVNPIGLSQLVGNNHLGRYDFVGRENFNRNWLDLSGPIAERVGDDLGADARENVTTIRERRWRRLPRIKPANELQTLRVEIMKLAADADVVLDLHCDMHAILHLFISRRDWPGPARELAADLGAEATLYNEPFPESLTFSGVNSALWPRLAAIFPGANIPQACLSATVEYRGQHNVTACTRRSRRGEPVSLHGPARSDHRPRRRAAAAQGRRDVDRGDGCRLRAEDRVRRLPDEEGPARPQGRDGVRGDRPVGCPRTEGAHASARAHGGSHFQPAARRPAGMARHGPFPHRRKETPRPSQGIERPRRLTRTAWSIIGG
jgi:predicted deacylase